MAGSDRAGAKTSARRNTNGTGSKAGRKRTAPVPEETLDNKLLQEIFLLVALALCVFLFLCNFGIMGSFGDILSNVQFGLFGLLSYIAPLLFFFALAFSMINRGSGTAKRKLAAGITLFVLVSMLCELVSGRLKDMSGYHIAEIYQSAVEKRNGGGALAGSLAYLSFHYLDTLGSVLVIVVLGLICIVLLTEKSVIGGAKKSGKFLAAGARKLEPSRYETEEDTYDAEYIEEDPGERRARLRAEKKERNAARVKEQEEKARRKQALQEERSRERRLQQEEKEDEKILRMNKKSRGVMLDTALTEKETVNKRRDEMHEITIREDIEEEFVPEKPKRYIPRKEAENDEVQEISYEVPADNRE